MNDTYVRIDISKVRTGLWRAYVGLVDSTVEAPTESQVKELAYEHVEALTGLKSCQPIYQRV